MEAIEGRSKWIEARVDRSRWVSQRESKSRGNSVIRRCLTGLRRAGSPRIRNAIPRRGHRPATPLFRAINSRKRHANEFFQFLSKLNSLSQSLLFLFPFLRSRDYNLPIPNNFLSFQSCETLAILFHIRRKNSIGIETLTYDSEWKNLREKEKVGVCDIERNERRNSNFYSEKVYPFRFATNNGISSALHILGEGKRKKGKLSSRTATHGARYFDR